MATLDSQTTNRLSTRYHRIKINIRQPDRKSLEHTIKSLSGNIKTTRSHDINVSTRRFHVYCFICFKWCHLTKLSLDVTIIYSNVTIWAKRYSHDFPTIFPRYSHDIPTIFQRNDNDISSHFNAITTV